MGYRIGSIKNKPKIKEVRTAGYAYNDISEEDRIDIVGNLNNKISTLRSSTVKNKKYFENEIKEAETMAHTYNDIPEEDRIDIVNNLNQKNNKVSTSKNNIVKNRKYSGDEIKKESGKIISEVDTIDIINNLKFNKL